MARRLRSDTVLGMGPEPIWSEGFSKIKLIDALNWYNYCYDQKKAKEFILTYCRHEKLDKKTVQKINSIPETRINVQIAWLSRMMIQGMIPDEPTQEFFD
ncbi:MAG: hypothetical protein ACO293_07620 [Nitrosopumilaceae archaeon]